MPKPSHRGQTVVQILQVDLEDAESSPASDRTLSLAAHRAIGTRPQASEAERRRRRRTPKRKRSPKLPPKNPAQQELPPHKVVVEEVVDPKEVETLPTTQGGEEEAEGVRSSLVTNVETTSSAIHSYRKQIRSNKNSSLNMDSLLKTYLASQPTSLLASMPATWQFIIFVPIHHPFPTATYSPAKILYQTQPPDQRLSEITCQVQKKNWNQISIPRKT